VRPLALVSNVTSLAGSRILDPVTCKPASFYRISREKDVSLIALANKFVFRIYCCKVQWLFASAEGG
jgi:hypothetical protein